MILAGAVSEAGRLTHGACLPCARLRPPCGSFPRFLGTSPLADPCRAFSGILRGVAMPAAVLPMTCGPSLYIGGGQTHGGGACFPCGAVLACACSRWILAAPLYIGGGGRLTHGARHAPLAAGMIPCGACLRASAPDDPCGPSLSEAGRDDSRRAGSHGGMIPCGGGRAPDDLRGPSLHRRRADSRRRACLPCGGYAPLRRCLLACLPR